MEQVSIETVNITKYLNIKDCITTVQQIELACVSVSHLFIYLFIFGEWGWVWGGRGRGNA